MRATGEGTTSPANGAVHAYPMVMQAAHTFTNIGMNNTVGSTGGVVDLGVYTDNGAGYPATLLAHTGAVVVNTGIGAITSALAIALGVGLFWLAVDYSASTVAPTVTTDGGSYGIILGSGSPGGQTAGRGYTLAGQPAALPAAFPGGAVIAQPTLVQLQA